MKRFLNGILALILAGAITVGVAYVYELWHSSWEVDSMETTEVTSEMTPRIYALDSGKDTETVFGVLDTTTDAWARKKVASSGGGKYTDTSGETHYVASSSGGGTSYSGGGGGGYYYYDDDDDDWYSGGGYSGGGVSGGGSYDDGPGYLVDIDWDDTVYNYCHNCGTEYLGTGGCPNPNCRYYNP